MAFFRTTLIAAIVSLLFVPALTRAVQPLDVGTCTVHQSGFHKAGDVPPDPVTILPDVRVFLFVAPAAAPLAERPRLDIEILPPDPAIRDGDLLRAPPAASFEAGLSIF